MIYVGIQCLLAKASHLTNATISHHKSHLWKAFRSGFICNVLNPKATLFFLGLFTLVINPNTPIWLQMLYGLEMFIVTFLWFATLSIIITHKRVKAKMSRIQFYLTKLMGILLILFGFEIALLQSS